MRTNNTGEDILMGMFAVVALVIVAILIMAFFAFAGGVAFEVVQEAWHFGRWVIP